MIKRVRATLIGMREVVRGAASRFGITAVVLWPKVLRRYLVDQFSVAELRAFAPFVSEVADTMPVIISKEKALDKLARGNSRSQAWKTENKEAFYEICRAAGIPHPKVCAVLGGGRATWLEELPRHFISKDVAGAHGSGFEVFERVDANHVRINEGEPEDLNGSLSRLSLSKSPLLLQERLFDHQDLQAIAGRRTLQTLRINTIRALDGGVRLLFWMLKLVVGQNYSDNFSGGKSGNLIAFGERNGGTLLGARQLHESGVGLKTIFEHPDSGVSIRGFVVPCWRDAVDSALMAHRAFPEFETLGWDVAVTDDGPRILEANAWWDPPLYAPDLMSVEDWRLIFG